MKRFWILLLILSIIFIFLYRCIKDYIIYKHIKDIKVDNIVELTYWVHNNIKYERDGKIKDKADFWQLPKETLWLKRGDCEDMSILLVYLAKKKFNINMDLVWVRSRDGQMAHMVTQYNDTIYDSAWEYVRIEKAKGYFEEFPVYLRYSDWDELINIMKKYHRKEKFRRK